MTSRGAFVTGAVAMALAVGLGAFGAHGLKAHTDAAGLATWETAVRYHAYHALAFLILAGAVSRFSGRAFAAVCWAFLAGMLIFSGTLYALVLSGQKWLGAVTPIGGVLLIAGWIIAAMTARRSATGGF